LDAERHTKSSVSQEKNKQEDTVKRVWIVVSLMAVGLMASSAFADVQNIRLSGDVRIRGYYFNYGPAAASGAGSSPGVGDAAFITQQTKVTCEADLEDHVMVVVTLKAFGRWGNDGDGLNLGDGRANKSWYVGMDEAYVQLNQAFFTPATVKVGRQYLNYGRGLILSSFDGDYNFDAGRLVLDYYPLTIDLVGASLVNNQNFAPIGTDANPRAADLLFLNVRYELTDSLLKDVEVYGGWIAQAKGSQPVSLYNLTSLGGASAPSPWIIGARADMNITKCFTTWIEGTYEGGASGRGDPISAFLANAGAKFTFADVKMTPAINANYIYASGGGASGRGYFRPWFDAQEGYNGYVFKPEMSNIQIFNLGASIKPANNVSLALEGYYYLLNSKASYYGDSSGRFFTNPNLDVPGGTSELSASRDLGWEFDTVLGYDYSKDVRCQLIYGVFIPGAMHHTLNTVNNYDGVAHGVRAELNVKF
jgi:hypothetical protein